MELEYYDKTVNDTKLQMDIPRIKYMILCYEFSSFTYHVM
jgi:hypothetical protein